MDRLRSGVADQPGHDGETPSLVKIQKLGSKVAPAGGHGAREGEVIISRLTS